MKKTFVTFVLLAMLSTFGFSQKGGFKPSTTYKPSATPVYKPSTPSAPVRTYTPSAPVTQPVRQTPVAVATPAPSNNGGFYSSTNKPAPIAASTPTPQPVVRQTTTAATPQPQATVSNKGWTSSSVAPQTQQKAPSLPDTDKAALMKAKEKGTVFETREQAISAFKQTELQKYKVSGFKREPETRPDYIPQQTTVSGQTHTIVYNNGGYGYYDPYGAWRTYEIAQDAAMLNALMARDSYYDNAAYYQLQQQQAQQQYYAQPQHVDSGWSFLKIVGTVLVIVIGIVVVMFMFKVMEEF